MTFVPPSSTEDLSTSYPGIQQSYELDDAGLSRLGFGKEILQEFGLDKDTVHLNHGSYGTVPNRVLELQHRYNRERERHPDLWYRANAIIYLNKSRQEIASTINANVDNVVLLDNVTSAVNCSLKSFPFKAGDGLLHTTNTYGAIQNLCVDFTNRIRPDVEAIHLNNIKLPIKSEDEVIDAYEDILKRHPNIKLAIIDHITSPTSIILPIRRMIRAFHNYGVKVIVDGAHAFHQLPLDMEEIGADVYTSNIHKWGYAPRGSSFMWFSDASREWIRPPNTSWEVMHDLHLQFFDQGTRDHVPGICARHGIQFYNAVGGMDKVVEYTSKLADEAKRLLEEIGLEAMQVPTSMEAPNMKVLKLPSFSEYPFSSANLLRLHRDMFAHTNVFGMIVSYDDTFWVRVSAQIYNDMQDMEALRDAVASFLDKQKEE